MSLALLKAELFARLAAKQDFYSFVKYFVPQLQKEPWQERQYQKILCELLEEAAQGKIRKLIVHLPPGAGKSIIISQLFPAYYLGKHPTRNFLASSHTYDFAVSLARKARLIWEHPIYQELFPDACITKEGVDREAEWQLSNRIGDYLTCGIGSRIAGRRADILLLDDYIGGPQDLTETKFQQIENWYFEMARDRLRKDAPEIIVCTPWHTDDLAQKLQRNEKDWLVVKFPIICTDPTAPFEYRQLNEVLFNDQAFVTQKQLETPIARAWAAKWLCNPIPESGNIFQKEWLLSYDESELPSQTECTKFAICDPALGEKKSDFSTIGIFQLHRSTKRIFLIDLIHQRLDYPTTLNRLEQLNRDPWLTKIFMETVSAQKGLAQFSWLKNLRVQQLLPKGDKVTRAEAATPKFARGGFLLPKYHTLRPEIDRELLSFPYGKHDDIVDVLIYAVQGAEEGLVGGNWNYQPIEEEINSREIYQSIVKPGYNREYNRYDA